jgi:hypothetical protein
MLANGRGSNSECFQMWHTIVRISHKWMPQEHVPYFYLTLEANITFKTFFTRSEWWKRSDSVTPLSWTSIFIYYRRCVTLWIFQTSIQSPTKQLSLITVLVSLSSTYSSTIKDWKTLKNTDLTDKPSNDFRLFQNWISVTYMLYDTLAVQLSCTAEVAMSFPDFSTWTHLCTQLMARQAFKPLHIVLSWQSRKKCHIYSLQYNVTYSRIFFSLTTKLSKVDEG